MKKVLKKIALTMFVVVNVTVLTAAPASAGLFSKLLGVPSAGDMMGKAENRYNIDSNAIKDFSEGFNVSGQKNLMPTVRLVFSPQDPKPGQKLTARAFAQFFNNPKEQLYYTWYLKRAKCAQESANGAYDSENKTVKRVDCDRDGSGDLDINDYKIEAARILAGDGFYPDDNPQGEEGAEDNDGYIARYGGDVKSSVRKEGRIIDPYYYYLGDYAEGKQYEIITTADMPDTFLGCEGVPVCIADEEIVCSAILNAEALAEGGEGGAGGGGGDDGAGGGGGAGGAGGDAETEVNSNREYVFPFCLQQTSPTCESTGNGVGKFGGITGLLGSPVCPTGSSPVCVTDPMALYPELNDDGTAIPVGEKGYTEEYRPDHKFNKFTCTDLDVQEIVAERNDDPDLTALDVDQYRWSCANDLNKDVDTEAIIECQLNSAKTNADLDRFHLFPRNLDGVQVGEDDGEFTQADEDFYGTDPFDPDTSDNRVNDEATIVGLGQDEFSWLYSPGDEVGVIVEGMSILTTKHADTSNKIMFATINNVCDYSDMLNKLSKWDAGEGTNILEGGYTKEIRGRNVEIPAVSYEDGNFEEAFNRCLNYIPTPDEQTKDNWMSSFVNPAKGGAATKLDVSLTYTPDNPINDPRSDAVDGKTYLNMGDYITVDSAINNAEYDNNRLNFKWTVYRSVNGNMDFDPENWEPIPRGDFNDNTPWEGNDLSSFGFRMNLENGKLFSTKAKDNNSNYTYIKVRLEVQEDFDLRAQELYKYDINRGKADVIIRISEASNRLRAYNVQTNEDLTATSAAEICSEGAGNTAQIINCPVVRNQIIKLVLEDVDDDKASTGTSGYDNFSWKLNGKPLYCPSGLDGCGGSNKMVATNFLATTGEVGTEYVVSVTANSVRSGDVVEVTRKFTVVEPYIAFCRGKNVIDDINDPGGIVGCEKIFRKKLGEYIPDQGGARVPQFSSNLFYAAAAAGTSSFTAGGRIRPEWAEGNSMINWFVDDLFVKGGSVGNVVNQTVVAENVPSRPGEVSTVTAKIKFDKTPFVRNALREYWKVTDKELLQKQYEASMQVHFTEDDTKIAYSTGSNNLTPPQAFMAALGVNAPGIVIFLFRVLLAVGLIVFVIGLLWRYLPQQTRKL